MKLGVGRGKGEGKGKWKGERNGKGKGLWPEPEDKGPDGDPGGQSALQDIRAFPAQRTGPRT